MKSPQEVALELLELREVPEHERAQNRQARFQRAADQRKRNKDARSRGYKNHSEYLSDEPGEDTRQADRFDHARDLRKHG